MRDFSSEKVPIEVVVNAIKSASTAPSGANKQPWHFAVVADVKQKNKLELLPKKKKKRSMTTEHLKNGLMILSL